MWSSLISDFSVLGILMFIQQMHWKWITKCLCQNLPCHPLMLCLCTVVNLTQENYTLKRYLLSSTWGMVNIVWCFIKHVHLIFLHVFLQLFSPCEPIHIHLSAADGIRLWQNGTAVVEFKTHSEALEAMSTGTILLRKSKNIL